MGKKYKLIEQLKQQGKDVDSVIPELMLQHGSISAIAEQFDVAGSTIQYHLRKAGFKYEDENWRQVTDKEVLAKYVELADVKLVATHFHIAPSYVSKALIRQLAKGEDGD